MYAETYFVPTVDGRELCVLQTGCPDGIPMMVHAGSPGSRLPSDAWVGFAVDRGVRLITYDRPGYGDSTPAPGRAVSAAAADVATIAEYLGVERMAVWGISGGGPHALACAALLPDIVVAAASFGSPTPRHGDDIAWLAGMGSDNAAAFSAAMKGHDELEHVIQMQASQMLSSDSDSLANTWRNLLCPADTAVLTRDTAGYLLESARVGLAHGVDGWVEDVTAFVSPWGIDLEHIEVPVMIVHGGQDKFVSISHARWLAARIQNAQSCLSEEDGHISALVHWFAHVQDWLIEKIDR